jgi:hypothetical protein
LLVSKYLSMLASPCDLLDASLARQQSAEVLVLSSFVPTTPFSFARALGQNLTLRSTARLRRMPYLGGRFVALAFLDALNPSLYVRVLL